MAFLLYTALILEHPRYANISTFHPTHAFNERSQLDPALV